MKEEITIIEKQAKPLIRWAGGKRWLLKHLETMIDINKYNTYHEPFIGGGSVFFKFSPKTSFISDSNEWLIETYISIKENPNEVIKYLKKFKKDKENYYKIRKINYSNQFKRSAQFIYLNQMSFNGIFRVNLSGKYNVPYGNREHYNFDYENIISVSSALQNTQISHSDFSKTIDNVKKGDLVFLDPPYTITHNLNGFVQYNQKIFSLEDQYKLAEMIQEIKRKEAFYILTNAAHKKVKEIFDDTDTLLEISRANVIGGKGAKRGKYSEYLFTNII
ncbi:DNA adenine methylase [Lacinutrix jangbogonensis]|uniref:DNA adenine methylase n=1 Tax=Lacinutrix jangbogonensis TaxID=1469557 RepID=UPI000691A1CE|nr:Dam family site-specific DNA-(adenine-N6)-methyltransferase [Lacinutrix jangbogonensis]